MTAISLSTPAAARSVEVYLRACGHVSPDGSAAATREAAAREHLRTGRNRIPAAAVVRGIGADDLSGIGPAVQIVTDDMALLVDSVLTTATQAGAVVEEVLHPVVAAERTAGRSPSGNRRRWRRVSYRLGERLGLVQLLVGVSQLQQSSRWNALTRLSLRDELYDTVRALCLDVITDNEPGEPVERQIGQWQDRNASRLRRARTILDDIDASGEHDLATLSVATRQLHSLVR